MTFPPGFSRYLLDSCKKHYQGMVLKARYPNRSRYLGTQQAGCRKCYWLHRNRSLQFTYHFATILSVHILDPTECNPVPFQNLCVPAVVNVIDPRGLDPCLGNLRNIRSLASNKQKLESYMVGQFTLAICSHQGGWCKFGCSSCSNPHIPGKIIGSEWF